MKRALPVIALVALVAVVVLLVGRGGSDPYLVRAIFDTGGFLVKGEEVRIAGATVGSIKEVNVTLPGETTSYEGDEPQSVPGKAVVVIEIDDAGFHDFRADAGCHIRPQSLIGEKYVDCRTTLPRAPGSEPPPLLRELPDEQRGAGQHLLPLGQNSASVDPDLIEGINELPYAQRFRLIFSELGASLAGRGQDLKELVIRANPVLRDVNRLFGELSRQRDELAQLNVDSDEILKPFARERASVAGFFANAGASAEASAEKGPELEESFAKLPQFMRELRKTMVTLKAFSDAATPVHADLGANAKQLTAATRALTPFSAASTVSLKSLGAAGEVAGPLFRQANPIVKKTRDLGVSGAEPTEDLARFLGSVDRQGGWDGLVDLIYNSAAASNEFDNYGHIGRSIPSLNDCIDYWIVPAGKTGCVANFNSPEARAETSSFADAMALLQRFQAEEDAETGGTSANSGPIQPFFSAPSPAVPVPTPEPAPKAAPEAESEAPAAEAPEAQAGASAARRALLDYLLGP